MSVDRLTDTSTKLISPTSPYVVPSEKRIRALSLADICLSLAGCKIFPLADGEADIHRILADDDGQHTAVGIDDISLGDVGLANLSRDRRTIIGVAEVDSCGRQVGLVAHHLPVGLLIGGQGLVSSDNGSGILVEQFLSPPQLKFGQHLGCLASLDCSLRRRDRRLEQSFLDAVERCAFLDQVAFLEEDLFEISRDARPDLHTLDGLHAADEAPRIGQWPCAPRKPCQQQWVWAPAARGPRYGCS